MIQRHFAIRRTSTWLKQAALLCIMPFLLSALPGCVREHREYAEFVRIWRNVYHPVNYVFDEYYRPFHQLTVAEQEIQFKAMDSLNQFLLLRNVLLSRHPTPLRYIHWFMEHSDREIVEVCSFLLYNDFDNLTYTAVVECLILSGLENRLHEQVFAPLLLAMQVKQDLRPYQEEDFRDKGLLDSGFEERHARNYEKHPDIFINAWPYDPAKYPLEHILGYVALLADLYGVEATLPERARSFQFHLDDIQQ